MCRRRRRRCPAGSRSGCRPTRRSTASLRVDQPLVSPAIDVASGRGACRAGRGAGPRADGGLRPPAGGQRGILCGGAAPGTHSTRCGRRSPCSRNCSRMRRSACGSGRRSRARPHASKPWFSSGGATPRRSRRSGGPRWPGSRSLIGRTLDEDTELPLPDLAATPSAARARSARALRKRPEFDQFGRTRDRIERAAPRGRGPGHARASAPSDASATASPA